MVSSVSVDVGRNTTAQSATKTKTPKVLALYRLVVFMVLWTKRDLCVLAKRKYSNYGRNGIYGRSATFFYLLRARRASELLWSDATVGCRVFTNFTEKLTKIRLALASSRALQAKTDV